MSREMSAHPPAWLRGWNSPSCLFLPFASSGYSCCPVGPLEPAGKVRESRGAVHRREGQSRIPGKSLDNRGKTVLKDNGFRLLARTPFRRDMTGASPCTGNGRAVLALQSSRFPVKGSIGRYPTPGDLRLHPDRAPKSRQRRRKNILIDYERLQGLLG